MEIWVDARWQVHPAVGTLGALLRSTAFSARLALVGGYDLEGCGQATVLTIERGQG